MGSSTLLMSIKRLTLLFALVIVSQQAFAQSDSCYVYTQIHWAPAMTKYVAQIQDEKGEFNIPTDDSGKKLYFYSIMNAINYYSSKGWELVDLYYRKGDQISELQQYAIIKKKMSKSESEKYTSPKP